MNPTDRTRPAPAHQVGSILFGSAVSHVDFSEMLNLASESFGTQAIGCSDDFFASMNNIVKDELPQFDPNAYTDRGKLMDGWESRRRRTPGFDWCIIELGITGQIAGVDVNTSFFTGNFPEFCSMEAADGPPGIRSQELLANLKWQELATMKRLNGGSHNYFAINSQSPARYVRLKIYPDGGVARLRVYGRPCPDWSQIISSPFNLAAAELGASALISNDSYFASKNNLILPQEARNMGEGWETRRRRRPGNDWIIVRLARPGQIQKIIVDTKFFKGNFPESCSLEGLYLTTEETPEKIGYELTDSWSTVLSRSVLQADRKHEFEASDSRIYSHVRLSIYPDGGISRLRIIGLAK